MAEKYPGDRAAYVHGLKAELLMLDTRPKDATRDRRIKEVEAELDRYSDEPKAKWRETAIADQGGGSGPEKPTSVKDILKDVGDDKAKAQAALDDELTKPVDDQRTSLLEKLRAVLGAE